MFTCLDLHVIQISNKKDWTWWRYVRFCLYLLCKDFGHAENFMYVPSAGILSL